jgi:hypothetical protein
MALEMRSEVRIFTSLAKAFHKSESGLEADVFGSAAHFIPKFLSVLHNIEKFRQSGLDTAADSTLSYDENFKKIQAGI